MFIPSRDISDGLYTKRMMRIPYGPDCCEGLILRPCGSRFAYSHVLLDRQRSQFVSAPCMLSLVSHNRYYNRDIISTLYPIHKLQHNV